MNRGNKAEYSGNEKIIRRYRTGWRLQKMEKHLELKERFDQLMKQDMDVSEHEQEWFELLDDMHEWLKDKTIPRNIRRQFEPLGMLEVTMKICDGIHYANGTGRYAKKEE